MIDTVARALAIQAGKKPNTTPVSSGTYTSDRTPSGTFVGWAGAFDYSGQAINQAKVYICMGSATNVSITCSLFKSDKTQLVSVTDTVAATGWHTFNFPYAITPSQITDGIIYCGYTAYPGTTILSNPYQTLSSSYVGSTTHPEWYESTTGGGTWQNVSTPGGSYVPCVQLIVASQGGSSVYTPISLRVNLPATINAVIGDTIELFYRGVVTGFDPKRYNINFVASKGNRYKNRWVYTPQSGDSNFTITVTIYDDANNQLAQGTTNVVINPVKSSPAAVKNVLCVGDSLTSGGEWVTELNRRLTGTGGSPAGLGLTNLNFIGTVGTSPNRYEGYSGWQWNNFITAPNPNTQDVWVTVTSGTKTNTASQTSIWKDSNNNQWQLQTIDSGNGKMKFIHYPSGGSYQMPASGALTFVSGGGDTTNIVYSATTLAGGNPFWNTSVSRNDFKNYCTVNGYSGIDYCFVLLGWNEIGTKSFQASDHSTTTTNAQTFINQLHADYPNCKVILVGLEIPSQDGLGTNYGSSNDQWNYYWTIQSVFGLNDAYQSIASNATYSSYVDFVHLSSQFDSENNMQTATRGVNVRNSTTETYGTNGVHPATSGYYQIADATYRNLMGKL